MEERFTQERKLIVENNSTQNKRQLDFIDQLIKDKQSLGEFFMIIPILHYQISRTVDSTRQEN